MNKTDLPTEIQSVMNIGAQRMYSNGNGPHIIALPDAHINPSAHSNFMQDPNVLGPYIALHDAIYLKLKAIRDKLTELGIDWHFVNEASKISGGLWTEENYNLSRSSQIRDFNEQRLRNSPTLSGPTTVSHASGGNFQVVAPGLTITMSLNSIRMIYNAQMRFEADCIANDEANRCKNGRLPEHTFGKEDAQKRANMATLYQNGKLNRGTVEEYLAWYRDGIAEDFRSRHEQILSQCTEDGISIVSLGSGHFESLGHLQSQAESFESQAVNDHSLSVYKLDALPPKSTTSLDIANCTVEQFIPALPRG